nr:reverse transcriptase domain-containing protein [Tanacetum cinerariifolium]
MTGLIIEENPEETTEPSTDKRADRRGKRWGDADLKKPFKEMLKTHLTKKIIEFVGPENKMPANIKLYDGTTDPEDHLSRFASEANSEEWPKPVWCSMFQRILWCEKLDIRQMNTVVAHPQANGLVERANKSLMEGIKTRLGRDRFGYVHELPNVLWAHWFSLKQRNGETLFSLTYESDSAEIGMPTHSTMMIWENKNEEELRLNLDLLQERREVAAIREAKYK